MERAIGVGLRTIRQRDALTQADIAHRLGVSYQAVQRYETGKAGISLSSALSLCSSLNIPFTDLLAAIPSPTPPSTGADS